MNKLRAGAVISARELTTIRSKRIQLPDPTGVVHLQFRRYEGCPFCNLHLRSIAQRHHELLAAGIREVVVFQSSPTELLTHHGDVPFAVIADPTRTLYAEFGAGSSPRAVLDPRAWLAGVRAVTSERPSPPANPPQALGLPADFLVAADGHVLACKYVVHAYDQWSADDLLQLAGHHIQPTDHRLRTSSAHPGCGGRHRPGIRPSAAARANPGQPAQRTGLARRVIELLAPANLAGGQLLLVGWRSTPRPAGLGWGLPVATFGGLLPYGIVMAGVSRQRWTDLRLRTRQQRPAPPRRAPCSTA
jgi:hypothetical protein